MCLFATEFICRTSQAATIIDIRVAVRTLLKKCLFEVRLRSHLKITHQADQGSCGIGNRQIQVVRRFCLSLVSVAARAVNRWDCICIVSGYRYVQ